MSDTALTYTTEQKKTILIYGLLFCVLIILVKKWEFIPIYLLSVLSLFSQKNRLKLLTTMNIIAFFILNPFYINSSYFLRLKSFIIFILFNAIFILISERLPILKRRAFQSMLFVGLLFIATITVQKLLSENTQHQFVLLNPVFFSFWTYCGYLRDGLGNHSFFSKLLWFRPFWFSWVLPLGNTREVSIVSKSLQPFQTIIQRLNTDLKEFSLFILAFTIFENLFFTRTYYTYNISIISHIMNLPYTHTDGFKLLLNGNYSRFEAIMAQLLSSLHFIGNSYLYSTVSLVSVTLCGGLIKPHTTNFWRAKSFTDYYFQISHHYSVLIRNNFLRPLIAKLSFISNHYLKLFVGIFISVTCVSLICSYLGRGFDLKADFFSQQKNLLFFQNYHYAVISGIICALSQYFETKKYSVIINSTFFQIIRVMLYLSISAVLYTFIFNYLVTDIDTRTLFLKFVFLGN